MKRTLVSIGLGLGAFWLYNKYKTVNGSLDLLKIEDPQIRNLGMKNGNVTFELELPVLNPESQTYSGKVISVRVFRGDEEIAYSEPGVVTFNIAAASRTLIRGITMNVPPSKIDTVLSSGWDSNLTYKADVEVAGVKLQFNGKLM